MEPHEGVRALTLPLETFADEVAMTPGLVDAAIALSDDGDVAIRRSWLSDNRLRVDDHSTANVVEALRLGELDIMGASVDTINDQIDLLLHLVAGDSLAKDAADDRRAGALAVKEILVGSPLLRDAMIVGTATLLALHDLLVWANDLKCRHIRLIPAR